MNRTSQSISRSGRAEAGFTLIEVLIAIVVLVFGLIAVTNLFLVAGSSNTVANQATASADVAAQILENLKAQPWNSASLAQINQAGLPTTPQQTDTIPGVGIINSWWSITDIEPSPNTRTKFIRVRSEGTGVLSRGRSRAEFTTYRACTTPNLGCP
jgi:prepilin-type N-terminal cleavage/methylation domain-containing protein